MRKSGAREVLKNAIELWLGLWHIEEHSPSISSKSNLGNWSLRLLAVKRLGMPFASNILELPHVHCICICVRICIGIYMIIYMYFAPSHASVHFVTTASTKAPCPNISTKQPLQLNTPCRTAVPCIRVLCKNYHKYNDAVNRKYSHQTTINTKLNKSTLKLFSDAHMFLHLL